MVASFGATRRRDIRAKGRTVILRRQTGVRPPVFADVTLLAFFYAYRPDQIKADLKQGDQRAEILNDEIAAAGWPGPPKIGDTLAGLHVIGAVPVYDGETVIGHSLTVRG